MSNWAGNVDFDAARVFRPSTTDELRRIVANSERIRVLGRGHSFSGVLSGSGDVICLGELTPILEIDPVDMTVTVAAGMRYTDVAAALHRAGFALANLASLPDITVAGACATGTHGSGDTNGGLATSAVGLQLVDPSGDLVELSRDVDQDTFAGAVVGLGALGVVTRLTLKIEPTFEVRQTVRTKVPLAQVRDRFDEVFGAAYSVSVFTRWVDDATVWLKQRTDRSVTKLEMGTSASGPLHPVPEFNPESCTEQLGAPGPWHERLPHFRPGATPDVGDELQSEYFLPRAAGPAALAALTKLGPLLDPVLEVGEIRTVRADDLWLSPSYGRDSVTVHFTWFKDAAKIAPLIAAVEERLVPLGARPHWGKLTALAGPRLLAGYERGGDFLKLLRKFDAAGKFRNDLVDGMLAEST